MKAERFGDRLFAAHLVHGEITLRPNRTFVCVLLVQDVEDVSFIKQQALKLVMAGCSGFDLYGEKASLWMDALKEAHRMLHPALPTDRRAEFVRCFGDVDSFMDQVQMILECRPFVPYDIYLLYDHNELYELFLKRLGIFHHTMILDDIDESLRRLHYMKAESSP